MENQIYVLLEGQLKLGDYSQAYISRRFLRSCDNRNENIYVSSDNIPKRVTEHSKNESSHVGFVISSEENPI